MGIQALREKRAALLASARKILDDHPGSSWRQQHAEEVDRIYAEVDMLDRRLSLLQSGLDAEANINLGHLGAAGPDQWRNPSTGAIVPVAYAKRGKISAQLQDAFSVGKNSESGERPSLTDFMRGVAGIKVTESIRNSLTEGTDSQGGYMLPAFLQGQMLDALAPVSALLTAGAGVSVLDQGAKSYRLAAMNTIPTAAWRAESGAVATSDPAFRSVDLIPRSLAFQFKVSRELLADASNLEQALFNVIAKAFAKELDRAGLRGSGTPPEIRGVLNTSGIQLVTNGANGASLNTAIWYANFITALQSILEADGPMPTGAIMAPRSLATLAGLLDTTNQPRRKPTVLENWNFVATSQIPKTLTVGTSSDCSEIYIADFSTVCFFMREAVSIRKLIELYAGTGEVGFVCHVRCDLGVLYPAAIAVATGVRA